MKERDGLETEIPADKLKQYPPSSWMVRPCEHYKEEYKDCRSIKERFHQYFIHGTTLDCTHWKEDYDRCTKFRKTDDINLLDEIVKSEKERIARRLEGHFANDVWEPRESPPSGWFDELPNENIQNMNKSPSYLGIMQKEAEKNPVTATNYGSTCSIL